MTADYIPIAEFVEESIELLQQMEEAVLELDSRPGDRVLVDQLFRGMHTIKGGAAILMRPDLADYAHRLESLLDQVRGGQVSTGKTLISTLLEAIDCVGLFISGISGGLAVDQTRVDASIQNVSALADRKSTRLNSSHALTCYAVLSVKKKNKVQLTSCRM